MRTTHLYVAAMAGSALFPGRQALTGCATGIVSARCAANSAFMKTAT